VWLADCSIRVFWSSQCFLWVIKLVSYSQHFKPFYSTCICAAKCKIGCCFILRVIPKFSRFQEPPPKYASVVTLFFSLSKWYFCQQSLMKMFHANYLYFFCLLTDPLCYTSNASNNFSNRYGLSCNRIQQGHRAQFVNESANSFCTLCIRGCILQLWTIWF